MTTADTLHVVAPLSAGLCVSLAFFSFLNRRRRGEMPWFELGTVYVAAVTLYLAYPLIGFLALDGTYTPLNDRRLYDAQPPAVEVGRVGWLYVANLVGFAVVYTLTRGRLPMQGARSRGPRQTVLLAAAATYGLIAGFEVIVGLLFDTSATTYSETYLAARRLPLFLAQLMNHATGAKFAVSLILLTSLFWRFEKYRLLLGAWLLAVAALTAVRLGSRTDLVLLLLAAAMLYHHTVRALSARVVVGMGAVGLAVFIAFGVVRGLRGNSTEVIGLNPFVYSSEFETLFANAVHLNRIEDNIPPLPIAFYLADLAALVPQQVAPFPKIDRADWYVSSFFPGYAAGGGGLAFGAPSEAILAGGWIASVLFGGALGFCFARIHRVYAWHPDSFWVFVLYVWVTTLSYQAFRNTTFSLLVLFGYRFIPAFVAVNLVAYAIALATPGAISRGRRRRRVTEPDAT